MSNEYETLMRCVRSVRTKTDFVPKVALVLGSGLGDYASQLRVEAAVDYHEIEGFPVSTVPGHTGRLTPASPPWPAPWARPAGKCAGA